jgi:hypothetical protein
MLATMQRVLRNISGRHRAPAPDGSMGKLTGRRRQARAQSLQHLVDRASRSESASQLSHPEWEAPLLLRTRVVEACRPEPLAIKDAIVDARQPIAAAALKQLKAFVTDPSGSPLSGGDPMIARRAAGRRHRGSIRRP